MLGHDVMSAGLQKYFQRHAFSHTTLNDFTVCLEEALAQERAHRDPEFLPRSNTADEQGVEEADR